MKRIWRFLFQLIALVIVIILISAAVIVFDGVTDRGDKADAVLVTGHVHHGEGKNDPLLDHVVEMYKTGKTSQVIVIGATWREVGDEDSGTMVKYLKAHGVPETAILESNHGTTTEAASQIAADMAQKHTFASVMIVADYYDISRLKMALKHEGVLDVEHQHVGTFRKEDVVPIGNAVVKLYAYVGKVYLMPAAEKMKQEAKIGMDKATADAQNAKAKVDKSLDSLAK